MGPKNEPCSCPLSLSLLSLSLSLSVGIPYLSLELLTLFYAERFNLEGVREAKIYFFCTIYLLLFISYVLSLTSFNLIMFFYLFFMLHSLLLNFLYPFLSDYFLYFFYFIHFLASNYFFVFLTSWLTSYLYLHMLWCIITFLSIPYFISL